MPELVVRVVGDTSALEKSFKRASRATANFNGDIEGASRGALAASLSFRGLGRAAALAGGGFLTGAGLALGLKQSISLASDLNEQISKTNVVFGSSSREVQDWSKQSAQALGLARNEALGVASSFGAMFAPLGVAGREAAKQSQQLTQLGADLASFYNTSVSDALDAIRSGIVGESEPLRRYGVLLSETRVQQEALTETGKKNVKQLTDHDKVLARISLIYKDSSQAQGDFARTSGGLANQTRILQAQLKDLGTELGQTLIPALTDLVVFINTKGIPALRRFGDAAEGVISRIGGLAEKLKHSSPLFEITGKDLGKALVQGVKIGLGMEGSGASTGGDIGAQFDLLVGGAIGELKVGVARILAEAAKTRDQGLAASTLGADASRRQRELPTKVVPGAADQAAARRNQIFDTKINRLLDRVQDIKSLRGQIAQLKVIEGLVKQRIDVTNDLTRQQTLGDTVAQIERQITEAEGTIADNQRKASEDARKKEKAAAAANLRRANDAVAAAIKFIDATNKRAAAERKLYEGILRRRGAQRRAAAVRRAQQPIFAALGLTPQGAERIPTARGLLAQLNQVSKQIAGTSQDTPAVEKRIAKLRKALRDGFGKLTPETRQLVKDFLDALAGKDTHGTGPATRRQAASIKQLVAGTGLDRAGLRRLELNLAGAHLTTPTVNRRGQPIVVHTTVELDGRQVARNTTDHQAHDKKRRPTQTRGRVQ